MKNSKINLANEFPLAAIKLVFKNNRYYMPDLSAKEISESWNYKQEGLKVEDARELLRKILNRKSEIHNKKPTRGFFRAPIEKVKIEIQRRQTERRRFQMDMQSAKPIGTYKNYEYGKWDTPIREFRVNDTTFARIVWTTESDWDYYSKSYGRPKNTYSNRRVEFHTFDWKTATKTVRNFALDTFAGNFMEKALAWFYNTKPVKVSKELQSVQLNPVFSLNLIHQIGGVKVYERRIGEAIFDYCILTADGTTYHDVTRSNLASGLRRKTNAAIQAERDRLAKENELLTADIAHERYGFCWTGMRTFCELNEIDIEGSYTIRDIRAAVIPRRAENCAQYRTELKTIGIALNCK